MDDPYACAHAGLRLEMGQGAPRDIERAKALYRMACARGICPIPCEGLRRLGEEPPSTVASSAEATESIDVSKRFDWEWRLPANWQFVPAGSLPLADGPADAEVVAARPRDGAARESLMFVVGVCEKDASAPYKDRYKATLDTAGRNATAWLAGHGVGNAAATRKDFWGNPAVRVDGRLAPPDGRSMTLTLFCKQEKLFEMRCLSPQSAANEPCVDALGWLMFHEPKRAPNENPRVLHLREKRFGVAFDAPDDSWLAMRPTIRGGEARLVVVRLRQPHHRSWWSCRSGAVPDSAFARLGRHLGRREGRDGHADDDRSWAGCLALTCVVDSKGRIGQGRLHPAARRLGLHPDGRGAEARRRAAGQGARRIALRPAGRAVTGAARFSRRRA